MKKIIILIMLIVNVQISFEKKSIDIQSGLPCYSQACNNTNGMAGYGQYNPSNNSSGTGSTPSWWTAFTGLMNDFFNFVGQLFNGQNVPTSQTYTQFGFPSIYPLGYFNQYNNGGGGQDSITYTQYTYDCQGTLNGNAEIDSFGTCVNGFTFIEPCNTPKYYTTIQGDTTKYYNNDTITIAVSTNSKLMTLHNQAAGGLPQFLNWFNSCYQNTFWWPCNIEKSLPINTADEGLCQILITKGNINSQTTIHSNYVNVVTPPAPKSIRINNNPKKYYDGEEIYIASRINNIDSLFLDYSNNIPPTNQLRWFKDSVQTCAGNAFCAFDFSASGIYIIRVNDAQGNKLIQVKVIVCNKSVVKFHNKPNYTGEYGFDEVGYQHDSLKNDYQKFNICNFNYKVPWMSLLHGQSDTIAVEPLVSQADLNNSSFWVEIKSSNSDSIKINNFPPNTAYHLNASQLANLTKLKITGFQFSTMSNRSRAFIYAVNNSGDTVGKLHISCQKPINKKLVIIYTNTGTGYRDTMSLGKITKVDILNMLNQQSHNQIFKKWNLDSTLTDKIDITTEYNLDSMSNNFTGVQSPRQVPINLLNLYKTKTGYDHVTLNNGKSRDDATRFYFLFITDLPMKGGSFSGVVNNKTPSPL